MVAGKLQSMPPPPGGALFGKLGFVDHSPTTGHLKFPSASRPLVGREGVPRRFPETPEKRPSSGHAAPRGDKNSSPREWPRSGGILGEARIVGFSLACGGPSPRRPHFLSPLLGFLESIYPPISARCPPSFRMRPVLTSIHAVQPTYPCKYDKQPRLARYLLRRYVAAERVGGRMCLLTSGIFTSKD
ncbi:hypothetical protein GQ53DRAFT_107424 [Thozetella sp. PMI_491]|nr:hypothetical protein GQ53DRAFT_107424 [Thozetella sp. PMI_491]